MLYAPKWEQQEKKGGRERERERERETERRLLRVTKLESI
jgi:hypothetical protein